MRRAATAAPAGGLALAGLLALGGCGGSGAPAAADEELGRAWPEGTVLAVDDLPIGAEEVDRAARWVGFLYPEDVLASRRRKALTTIVLPRAAARARHAAAREAALGELGRARTALLGGGGEAPEPEERSGSWKDLALDLWGQAWEHEPGAWSEPLEGIGLVRLLRVEEAIEGRSAAERRFHVLVVEVPYVPEEGPEGAGSPVEAALDASRLTIVDPAWREIVPYAWVHRMDGE